MWRGARRRCCAAARSAPAARAWCNRRPGRAAASIPTGPRRTRTRTHRAPCRGWQVDPENVVAPPAHREERERQPPLRNLPVHQSAQRRVLVSPDRRPLVSEVPRGVTADAAGVEDGDECGPTHDLERAVGEQKGTRRELEQGGRRLCRRPVVAVAAASGVRIAPLVHRLPIPQAIDLHPIVRRERVGHLVLHRLFSGGGHVQRRLRHGRKPACTSIVAGKRTARRPARYVVLAMPAARSTTPAPVSGRDHLEIGDEIRQVRHGVVVELASEGRSVGVHAVNEPRDRLLGNRPPTVRDTRLGPVVRVEQSDVAIQGLLGVELVCFSSREHRPVPQNKGEGGRARIVSQEEVAGGTHASATIHILRGRDDADGQSWRSRTSS
eukprot:scaffold8692_cov134-Isochrysis_galbana.AAC.2